MKLESSNWPYVLFWLLSGTVLAFLSYTYLPATFVDGVYIPAGNDSTYHARRILDAAVGERGFYQFDDRIHVPEGSWLTWPWAYDYLMALALKVALFVNPRMEPMKFLAFVPMWWTFVNAGLFTLILKTLRVHLGLAGVAVLAFSISGVILSLHTLGNIDHHFIELSFVLATVLTALRFFAPESRPADAIMLGVVLGMAPAFHNILFILQVPVVASIALLWLRGVSIEPEKASRLAAALFGSCLLFLLPSATFREFFFEYTTHSWFHLYIAFGSSVVIVALSRVPFSLQNLGWVALGGLLLASPLLFQIVHGILYIRGESVQLGEIEEVKGPLEMYLRLGRSLDVTRHYSWLILLAPVMIALFAWRLLFERRPAALYFAVAAVIGLGLLLMQYRMHPFGFWALLVCPVVLLDELIRNRGLRAALVGVPALAVVALAYQPTLRHQFFNVPLPSNEEYYANSRFLYPRLAEECATDPGIVLSYTDEGHHVRYHTECTVIANNFLLTPQHGQKVLETRRLLDMTPEEFLATEHDVKYIFLRLYGVFRDTKDGREPTPLSDITINNARLFIHLVAREEIPEGFELLKELRLQDERDIPYARLFRVVGIDETSAGDAASDATADGAQ